MREAALIAEAVRQLAQGMTARGEVALERRDRMLA
jgi:hypothetical protein